MPGDAVRAEIRLAGQRDLAHLARLLWGHASPDEQALQSVEDFAVDMGTWWRSHVDSQVAFVAQLPDAGIVGMAWLALLPRVPRPGTTTRLCADIQSVYVAPQHRGMGLGAALITAATDHATRGGAGRVTVHSGRTARSLYERLGFAPSPQLLQRAPD